MIFEKTGTAFIGKVFILTHPRWFGFIVNPLTMYYCFDPADKLTHMIGEITNTPWKERHTYVLSPQNYDENIHTFRFKKAFHVSPFLPMEMDYTWKMSNPAGRISVDIWNHVEGRLDFEAHLALSEEPLTSVHLLTHWLKDPWITLKTLFGIYWHAGLLYFVKKVHFYSHPKLKNVS